jgi:hypothetical protein
MRAASSKHTAVKKAGISGKQPIHDIWHIKIPPTYKITCFTFSLFIPVSSNHPISTAAYLLLCLFRFG